MEDQSRGATTAECNRTQSKDALLRRLGGGEEIPRVIGQLTQARAVRENSGEGYALLRAKKLECMEYWEVRKSGA